MALEEMTPSQDDAGETAILTTENAPPETESFQEKPEDRQGETPDGTEEPAAETGELPTDEDPSGEEEKCAEGEDGEPVETKLVVHIQGGRAAAAVWRTGADPHMETLPGCRELEDALSALPGLIERANARWAESPMWPKHRPPRKARTRKTGNDQPAQPAAEPQQENQQPSMPRLF